MKHGKDPENVNVTNPITANPTPPTPYASKPYTMRTKRDHLDDALAALDVAQSELLEIQKLGEASEVVSSALSHLRESVSYLNRLTKLKDWAGVGSGSGSGTL